MAIEIVSFPIKNGGSFHSYVSLPEAIFFVGVATASSTAVKRRVVAGTPVRYVCTSSIDTLGTTD
jgi:hypothetical protein